MKFLLPLLLAVANPAADSGSVSSANASYDGNALVLKGQVVLDHGLGKMQAEEAVLQRQETGKDFPFSLIHLQKDVLLSLKSTASLKCDTADLDFITLKGTLLSNDKVVYTDAFKKKKGASALFRLSSKAADLQLSKKGEASQKIVFDIDTIIAKENVQIDYADAFVLHADHAIYRKSEINPAKPEFQSNVSAYPKDSETPCRLAHGADIVDAEAVDFDLVHSKVAMVRPKGVIQSLLIPELANQQLRFTAESLLWDHLKNTVILKGNISLNEPSLGTLVSEDELQFVQRGKQLASIRTKGKTTLQYLNAHTLTCFGAMNIDRDKLHATGDSPVVQGVVPEGQQIFYQEGEVGVFADKAQIEYSAHETSFQPVSISLKGNVKISSRDARRLGVADRVTYSPTTRTFILGADPGKRVLFINDEENLRISAQEVHITEDPTTKKQTVKGIGNVQLALTTEEQALIQKLFKLNSQIP
jgi:lipopolysaccharide export system protein LptA